MARKLTQGAYARRRGVTRQSVHQAVGDGLVPTDGNGLIDAAVADACWPRAGKSGPGTLADARRELAAVKAERERLRLSIERGDYVERAEVERDAFAAGRASRDRVLAFPARLVPLIVTSSDPAEYRRVQAILDAEATAIAVDLSDLSRWPKRTARQNVETP